MSKFNQEVDIPEKSVLIVNQIVTDKRLGKSPKKRLTIAYVYGLLRRTFNLSMNNIKSHYNKKFNIIYCINRVSTLSKRSGLNQKTIRRALNALEETGYIIRRNNRRRHLTYINLPLVLKYHLLNKQTIKAVDKITTTTGQKYHSHRTKIPEAPDKNGSRCNDSYVNDSSVSDSCCSVQGNNNNKQKDNEKNINLINSWISNTAKHGILPIKVTSYIGKYLIKRNMNYKVASKIANTIMNIKNSINTQYKGVYYSDYYKSENNPYIQNGELLKSLKKVLDNNKDLKIIKGTVKYDYQNYIDKNSNLKLRNDPKSYNNNLPSSDGKSKRDKYWDYYKQIKLLHNGMLHAKNTKEKNKIQDMIEKYAHKMIKCCVKGGEDMEDIPYTKKWRESKKLQPTDKATVKKLHRQLHKLNKDNSNPYEDAKGVEHASTDHDVLNSTKVKRYFDMDTGKSYTTLQLKKDPSLAPKLAQQLGILKKAE